jgi:hypothetical protein
MHIDAVVEVVSDLCQIAIGDVQEAADEINQTSSENDACKQQDEGDARMGPGVNARITIAQGPSDLFRRAPDQSNSELH